MAKFYPIEQAGLILANNLKNCSGVIGVNIIKSPFNQQPYLLVKLKSDLWQSAIPNFCGGHRVIKETQKFSNHSINDSNINQNIVFNYLKHKDTLYLADLELEIEQENQENITHEPNHYHLNEFNDIEDQKFESEMD